jgi:hypothetical protein
VVEVWGPQVGGGSSDSAGCQARLSAKPPHHQEPRTQHDPVSFISTSSSLHRCKSILMLIHILHSIPHQSLPSRAGEANEAAHPADPLRPRRPTPKRPRQNPQSLETKPRNPSPGPTQFESNQTSGSEQLFVEASGEQDTLI